MSLLYAIESCLRATRVPPSRFGREAVCDPRLVHDLRRGRQPGAAIERRVRAHIAAMLAEKEQKALALSAHIARSLPSAARPAMLVRGR